MVVGCRVVEGEGFDGWDKVTRRSATGHARVNIHRMRFLLLLLLYIFFIYTISVIELDGSIILSGC